MEQTAPAAVWRLQKQVSMQSCQPDCLPVWCLSGAQLGASPGSEPLGETTRKTPIRLKLRDVQQAYDPRRAFDAQVFQIFF